MKLYDYELSGSCWKVRFLLHTLGLACETRQMDFHPGREHKAEWFVSGVNPLGQLPVLEDGELVLRDAQAILVYLASRYDRERFWYPDDAGQRGEIQVWLACADAITRSAGAARLHDAFGAELDIEACRRQAHELFRVLDDHLAERQARGRRWLVGEHATLADIACFPYAELAPEGGIALDEYPALRAWLRDFRHRPGFIAMPGMIAPPP